MRGDGRTPTKWVSLENQRRHSIRSSAALKPSELTIPKKILDLIPPRPPGYGMHRELFTAPPVKHSIRLRRLGSPLT